MRATIGLTKPSREKLNCLHITPDSSTSANIEKQEKFY